MGGAINQADACIAEDLTPCDDSELLAECLGGNSAAWETLILRYRRLIYSIPIKAGLPESDAADVFQSVCLKLFENLSALRDHTRVGPWLITTASRESWRVSARRRREQPGSGSREEYEEEYLSEVPSTTPLADEQAATIERQYILRRAIDALPERSRMLIELLFYQKDELSYAEIARRMNMPVSSIGPTRARCLEKLKMIIGERL
ncbi:MAG: sigma-70 family RNA polymerase sigma factor [Blastocatellia bacterium]|nr:sigma-70 family RNA polymerase sigma factor [Blastocatellia bacterium]